MIVTVRKTMGSLSFIGWYDNISLSIFFKDQTEELSLIMFHFLFISSLFIIAVIWLFKKYQIFTQVYGFEMSQYELNKQISNRPQLHDTGLLSERITLHTG